MVLLAELNVSYLLATQVAKMCAWCCDFSSEISKVLVLQGMGLLVWVGDRDV